MTHHQPGHCRRPLHAHAAKLLAMLVCSAIAMSAWAQYKVVDAEGNVTYTDRPPANAKGTVTPVAKLPSVAAPVAILPAEVRAAAQRHPVTLYAGKDCKPCDAGRDLLRQRGIPYAEKRVESAADADALKQLSGDLSLPVLAVGAKLSKGLSVAEWQAHLDAAGYPAQTRLPVGYAAPAPVALAAAAVSTSRASAPPAAAPVPAAAAQPRSERPSAPSTGIRF